MGRETPGHKISANDDFVDNYDDYDDDNDDDDDDGDDHHNFEADEYVQNFTCYPTSLCNQSHKLAHQT